MRRSWFRLSLIILCRFQQHLVTGILGWMEFNFCETQHHAHAHADFFNTLKRYVCLLSFRPTPEFIHHMETSPLSMKGCKFWPMYTASTVIEEWWFFSMTYMYLLWHVTFVLKMISEDPWHSHILPCIWQWSCHYIFQGLMSATAENRTPNLRHGRVCLFPFIPLQDPILVTLVFSLFQDTFRHNKKLYKK